MFFACVYGCRCSRGWGGGFVQVDIGRLMNEREKKRWRRAVEGGKEAYVFRVRVVGFCGGNLRVRVNLAHSRNL